MTNKRRKHLPANYAQMKLMQKISELNEKELKYINQPDPVIKSFNIIGFFTDKLKSVLG